jgi:hypothetical protein
VYCNYVPVNSASLHCALAYTRMDRISEAEVRSAIPAQSYRTRLVGAIADGAECIVDASSSPALQFFSQYVPVQNEAIAVRYRSSGRALVRITDTASIAAHANGSDDGVRGAVRHVVAPPARSAAECEQAALALLDDSTLAPWSGTYRCASDLLPSGSASDVFPGDALAVNIPSRAANFTSIVRQVDIEVADPNSDRSLYTLAFANDAAATLGFEFNPAHLREPLDLTATTATAGSTFIADLAVAEVTGVTSTTVSIDAGATPPAGGGIEVRTSDSGWGLASDRNLLGRFTTQAFSVTRLTRLVTYYLRQYDASSPPKYSRYSAALHVDYPL